jgi:hypothetical protein
MSTFQFKPQPSSDNRDDMRSNRPMRATAGGRLVALGIALVEAESGPAIPGLCARCESKRNAWSSTAQYPNVFCSIECEQEFIRITLESVTLEDCIRMQERLEDLLSSPDTPMDGPPL